MLHNFGLTKFIDVTLTGPFSHVYCTADMLDVYGYRTKWKMKGI